MNKAEKDAWFAQVASLPCACINHHHECQGRITLHHPIGVRWRGLGQRADDRFVIPLCEAHHQTSKHAIHVMGMRPWELKYRTQAEMVEWVQEQLGCQSI